MAKLETDLSARTELNENLRARVLLLALPAMVLSGLALLVFADAFSWPVRIEMLCFSLVALPVIVLALPAQWQYIRMSLLCLILFIMNLLAIYWAPSGALLCALSIPICMISLLLGRIPGIGSAILVTLLLSVSERWLSPLVRADRIMAVAVIWGTGAFVWTVLGAAAEAIAWAQAGYVRIRDLLESARDQRVYLKQMQEDLLQANQELERVSNRLSEMRQAAEEARRIKEEFVANVSHELRTPLNMIVGFSEMIVGAPQTYSENIPPALLADLKVILRNSQHLSSLIDDILDLSQIEAGRWALTKERVALAEIIEAARVAVQPLYESKGLYLRTEIAPDLPLVFCDRTRIREVILNLLSNAGRFTERGGVEVRAVREGRDVLLQVTDTGPGIGREQQGKIFKPFEQLDGSIRRLHGGSGLGLSISKAFVDLHGGRMGLESELGRGTTFFVRLPIDPPMAVDEGPARWLNPYVEYTPRGARSLIPRQPLRSRYVVLESEDALKRLLVRYMDHVEVVSVKTWDDAIEELVRMPAQALLVNDVSVAEAFHHSGSPSVLPYGTPAIICSIPWTHETSHSLGITDYLVKPISREQLLGALERLQLKGRTVLIVDDEPEALRLFQRMLLSAERRYRVLRADDGQQALRILREQHPDVILLDLVMPQMDGFGLLRQRNADPDLRNIPVIVTAARDPAGQPIVSSALGLIRGGGLSVAQVLACIEALSTIAGPSGQSAGPKPSEVVPD